MILLNTKYKCTENFGKDDFNPFIFDWITNTRDLRCVMVRVFRQLEYKTVKRGGILVKVPTFYPSSQTYSICGYQSPAVKNLGFVQTAILLTTGTTTQRKIF